MNKVTVTTLVAIAGLMLGFLVWETGWVEPSGERGELRFRRFSSWDYDAVRDCVKSGKGSPIFSKYEQVFTTAPFGPPDPLDGSTYFDRSGSSLTIERRGGRTEVRLKSGRPISDEQKDLLEWCVLNPQLTWIPPEFRSK
jgi:hypothetical protein